MLSLMDSEEQEAPAPTGLSQRLREARLVADNGKRLSMEEAARRIGVAKATVQRWEDGTNTPRDHWSQVERVYGRSRLELEFGLTGESDPPYPGWNQFLDWLETVGERLRVEPWMVDNLRRMRVPEGGEITAELYKTGLFWLLSIPPPELPK